ncbi:DNA N-6-adenine-methyltransferase [Gordonia alkanivorans]|uniref:Putative DNA methyltransferase n=2 Tax=root TaxID=1 RepID=A0A159B6F7_9CAUD|nr:DNA N-6-adenine-methyltransferase [Gordonia alkanivorans]YP_009324456.1 DNA methyltransferase [Gordonia phage GAL1]AKJ72079.1 putative DNA methyltransferase [Gordonia phage GAL1]GAA13861.1 putative methyltransferase [Gordonia alkanivorans NBRC 16433]
MSIVGFRSENHPQQTGRRGAKDAVDDRGTDPAFIAQLEAEFGAFTLDVAAAPHNAKAPEFYTIEDNGLAQPWTGNVWCNPPYSNIEPWVEKAWFEWGRGGHVDLERIVMLLPANRCEQKWWQQLVEPERDRGKILSIRFLPGRMRFHRPNWTPGPKGDRPPFGCCLPIWSADYLVPVVNGGDS